MNLIIQKKLIYRKQSRAIDELEKIYFLTK